MKRDHLSFKPLQGDRYRCECGQEGTFDELAQTDCPKGAAPVYAADVPRKVSLVEVAADHYVKRFEVSRFDDYDRYPEFDRALAMKDDPRMEILRRLGAFTTGRWIAYSSIDGGYIGPLDQADRLTKTLGIVPQLRSGQVAVDEYGNSITCCIGFSEREQKWYGWSQRAMYGFGIGHIVEEGNVEASSWFI